METAATPQAAEQKTEMVTKVTLSSGKVVLLREMKMKYQTLAIKAVGSQAKDNQALMGVLAQQEILKQLVVEIDGVRTSAKNLEKLDDVFSYMDLMQLYSVVNKIAGGDDMGEIQTENVIIGGK